MAEEHKAPEKSSRRRRQPRRKAGSRGLFDTGRRNVAGLLRRASRGRSLPGQRCRFELPESCLSSRLASENLELMHSLQRLARQPTGPLPEEQLDELRASVEETHFAIVHEELKPLEDPFVHRTLGIVTAQYPLLIGDAFILFGGTKIILETVLKTAPEGFFQGAGSKAGAASVHKPELSPAWRRLANECLALLRRACSFAWTVGDDLGSFRDVIWLLWRLLSFPEIFTNAVILTEEVIAARSRLACLSDLPPLDDLMSTLSLQQLSSFCTVLVICLFDSNEVSDTVNRLSVAKKGLPRWPSSLREQELAIIKANHESILAQPSILKRLVSLLSVADQNNPNMPNLFKFVTSTPYTAFYIGDKYLLLQLPTPDGEEGGSYASLIPLDYLETLPDNILDHLQVEPDTDFAPFMAAMRAVEWEGLVLAFGQVEVFYVLCSLMSGSVKEAVQKALAQQGFGTLARKIFDALTWGMPLKPPPARGLHGVGCECNPEAALKIQFLRLVHNFCDNRESSASKACLLTASERAEVSGEPDFVFDAGPAAGEVGLLSRLTEALMLEPAGSRYSPYMASAIESYLRGCPLQHHELFVKRGLLTFLVNGLFDTGSPFLQNGFDLLSELVKQSAANLDRVEALVGDRFDEFEEIVVSHLVASNVLVRMLFLSKDCMDPMSRLHGLVSDPAAQINLVYGMAQTVTVEELNQDNLCCLNTCILLLLVVARDGRLPAILKGIAECAREQGDADALESLIELLGFWRLYYLEHDKESKALERSTTIPFPEWRACVERLLASQAGGDEAVMDAETSVAYWRDCVLAALEQGG